MAPWTNITGLCQQCRLSVSNVGQVPTSDSGRKEAPVRRALTAPIVASAVVAAGLTVPVVGSLPGEAGDREVLQREPVTATSTSLPLSGVDPSVIEESTVAMASWDSLVDSAHVEDLGLAPAGSAPLTFTSDEHAHDEHAHEEDEHGHEHEHAHDENSEEE